MQKSYVLTFCQMKLFSYKVTFHNAVTIKFNYCMVIFWLPPIFLVDISQTITIFFTSCDSWWTTLLGTKSQLKHYGQAAPHVFPQSVRPVGALRRATPATQPPPTINHHNQILYIRASILPNKSLFLCFVFCEESEYNTFHKHSNDMKTFHLLLSEIGVKV